MKLFQYKAFDQSGAKVDGQIEAIDIPSAQKKLSSQGLYPSEIKEFVEKKSLLGLSQKVNLGDLEFLTAELSLLLQSGVRIDKGLDIIKRTKAKPALAKLLNEMSASLKRGSSLSVAASEHPEAFDSLYVNLIELGEASGQLPDIFNGLAIDLKFRRDLQRKIIQSLTYPAVILMVCTLAVFFIFNFIVPQMSSLFSDADDLPWYTQFILSASDWMINYQGVMVIGFIVSGFGIASVWKQDSVRSKWQAFLLVCPGVRNSVLMTERIRFNSGLAMMLDAGLPIDRALELSTGNLKNGSIRKEMDIVRKKVKSGSSLTQALHQTSLFPDFYVSLLEVGEESGNLDRIFKEIASRSRQDFEEWTQKITTLIEPILILFMGLIVGGVVVVMLLSMVSVNDIGV